MRTLLAGDYKTLTASIVDDFIKNGTALDQLIAKSAESAEMNPGQIKTLIRGVNTMAHLALMDKKVDGDKYIDFKPVDPDEVVKSIYVETDTGPSRPDTERLADFLGNIGEAEKPVIEDSNLSDETKEASIGWTTPDETPAQIQKKKVRSAETLVKVAEELLDRKTHEAMKYRGLLEKLAKRFRVANPPDIEKFERDAIGVYGDFGASAVAQVRKLAHLPPTKTAAAASKNHVADDDTPEMEYLEAMSKSATYFAECHNGILKIETALKNAKK